MNGESLSVWVPLRSIVGMNEYQLGSQGLFIGYKNLMLPILQQVITLFWDLFKDFDDFKDPTKVSSTILVISGSF